MKKSLIILVAGAISVFSVSCKNESAPQEQAKQETAVPATDDKAAASQQQEERDALIKQTQKQIEQNGKSADIINRQDIDIRQYPFSEPRAKAVEVIRAMFIEENSYTIRAFFKHDGKLIEHRNNFRVADDYKTIRYLWVNDDEVLITFVSTDNSKQITFTITHDKGETSIKATHY